MKNTVYKKIYVILLCSILLGCAADKQEVSPISDSIGKGGSLARFQIVDNYMYFVDSERMTIYDLSNQEKPLLVNNIYLGNRDIETLFHDGQYLYIGSENGMFIYSIIDPKNPQFVSQARHVTGCDPVVSDGKYAYVTIRNAASCNRNSSANILEVFDVIDPTKPLRINTVELRGPAGLALHNSILFVCDLGELLIMDVSDPKNIKTLKKYKSESNDVIFHNGIVLTVGFNGIAQYRFDEETKNLTLLSTLNAKF